MADNKLEVKITSDTTGLKAGTQEAATAFAGATNQIKTSINALNATVSTQMKQVSDSFSDSIKTMTYLGKMFGGMIAGVFSVAAFKSAIDGALRYGQSIENLKEVLGVTASEASTLNTALQMIGKTSEDYIGVNFKLAQQIKMNEDKLRELGMATRDANGNLLSQVDLFQNAISTMQEYKEGTDRNQFALYAFGRSAADVNEYQRMTSELMKRATEVAKAYGLEIGEGAVEQTKRFKIELNLAGIILDSVKIKIGNALLPEIVKLSGELTRLIPVANAIIFVMKGIVIAVEEVALVFRNLYGFISAASGNMVSIIGTSWSAIKMIMAGNLSEAIDLMDKAVERALLKMKLANAIAEADAAKTHAFLAALWAETPGPTSGTTEGGGKSFPNLEGQKKAEIERLAVEQRLLEENSAAWGKVAQGELDALEAIQMMKVADFKEQLKLEAQALEDDAKAAGDYADEVLRLMEAILLLDNAESAAREKRLAEGRLKFDAELEGMKDEAISGAYQGWLDAMLENMKKADSALDAWKAKIKSISTAIFQPIANAFSGAIRGIIQGTLTLKEAMSNIFQSIVLSFIDMGIQMLMNWLQVQVEKLLISKATQAVEAISVVTSYAAQAAAGAYAATAGIPVVGPALAPAAAAEAFAATMAWAPVASAAGGWDVDRDSLAMLHKSEMVIPSGIADGLRGMISGGGPRGGKTNVNVRVSAMDGTDAFRVFNKHSRKIAKSLEGYSRNRYGVRR